MLRETRNGWKENRGFSCGRSLLPKVGVKFGTGVGVLLLEKGMATHSSILAWRIPMDRGAWWSTVHGVAELDRTEAT